MSQSIPEEPVFSALPQLSRRGSTSTTVERGTALWESLVGKPRGKASRESHRFLDPCDGKRGTTSTALEESARACPHSRRGLTPLRRLQKYPKIHVSTGEESSGSGRSEEHTSELQSPTHISYAVFCLLFRSPGSCHHSKSPPDVSVHSRGHCFPCTA